MATQRYSKIKMNRMTFFEDPLDTNARSSQKVGATQASVGGGTNKTWSTHTRELDSALTRKEILTPATMGEPCGEHAE